MDSDVFKGSAQEAGCGKVSMMSMGFEELFLRAGSWK